MIIVLIKKLFGCSAYDWPFNYESIVFKNVISTVSAS